MSDSKIDQELQAIKNITEALQPLDKESQKRALDYAIQHLGISISQSRQTDQAPPGEQGTVANIHPQIPAPNHNIQNPMDIRSLKEQKMPSSDIEMAVLVAYYLREVASDEHRKDEIGTSEIEKYFKQADYPLPVQPRFTLSNAKNAGYLEGAGQGKYKLNPVGHNLVAHSMPRTNNSSSPALRKKRSSPKKVVKKNKKQSR